MSDRTCTIEGCDRKHQARGLCGGHYAVLVQGEKRHRRQPLPCSVCGLLVLRRVDRNGRRVCCSTECRRLLTFGADSTNGFTYDWNVDALGRARRYEVQFECIDRTEVLERDGYRCYICAIALDLVDTFSPQAATVDHVVPLSQGGDHTMDNVRACCLHCNSSKAGALVA